MRQLALQPGALHALAVPEEVGIVAVRHVSRHMIAAVAAEAAVLQAHVVVVQRDNANWPGGEGVPVAPELRRSVVRQLESGLV